MDPLYALFGLGLVGFALYSLYQMRNKGPVDTGEKVIVVANSQETGSVPGVAVLREKHIGHQANEAETRIRLNGALLTLEEQKARARTIKETAEIEHRLTLELLKHEEFILELAKKMNLTPEDCKEYFKKLALDEAQRLHEAEQARMDIELGIIQKHLLPHQEVRLIQNSLDDLYLQVHLLENSNDPVKDQKIKERQKTIKAMEEYKREKERPLSSNSGKNKKGSLPPPQAPGNLRPQLGGNPQP